MEEQKHQSVIGKNLIEMLMFQMYGDSRLIYREYIQNARDAINTALETGVLTRSSEGQILVEIDKANRLIEIEDNGTGIPHKDVAKRLLNVAQSNKDGVSSAGQFGIGRLVGGYFCKRLVFKTSCLGEDCCTEVVFNIPEIRAILNDTADHCSASEVIDRTTEIHVYPDEVDRHYFRVTLEEVSHEYPALLNEVEIMEYLEEVAPVDFLMPFKNQILIPSLADEYQQLYSSIKSFSVKVNGIEIKKRYGLTIEGTGDKILSLQFEKFKDPQYGLLAWTWYAVTPFTKVIPIHDNNSRFRLRRHNIQVGKSDFLTDYFPKGESRGNKYFYGEIHIVNNNVKLNSSREGLADTPESLALKVQLEDFCDRLVKLYHLANNAKNAAKKLAEAQAAENRAAKRQAKDENGEATTSSSLTRAQAKTRLAREAFEKVAKGKHAQNGAAQVVLQEYSNSLVIPVSIDSIAKEDPEPLDKPVKEKKETKIEPDIFEPLTKVYKKDQIRVIKRVVKFYEKNAPLNSQEMLKQLTAKVIRELCK